MPPLVAALPTIMAGAQGAPKTSEAATCRASRDSEGSTDGVTRIDEGDATREKDNVDDGVAARRVFLNEDDGDVNVMRVADGDADSDRMGFAALLDVTLLDSIR